MFTGLIQTTQNLPETIHEGRLVIANFADDIDIGESISINGVCLTVVAYDSEQIHFDLSPETLKISALSQVKRGDQINIERAMKVGDRLGGHFVQGHVDGKVCLAASDNHHDYVNLSFNQVMPEHAAYLVPKGSITLNGVSLTLNTIGPDHFSVMIIPETQRKTNLSQLNPGDWVNVEYDFLVKAIQRTMQHVQEVSQ